MKHTSDTMEAEKDSLEEDDKFIKDLSANLKKKHESKMESIKHQQKIDDMVEHKKKEVKQDKKNHDGLEKQLNKFGIKTNE